MANLRLSEVAASVLKERGVPFTTIRGGKHIKFRFVSNDGLERTFPAPWSHSDHRSEKNLRAQLRRLIEGQGTS